MTICTLLESLVMALVMIWRATVSPLPISQGMVRLNEQVAGNVFVRCCRSESPTRPTLIYQDGTS